MKIDSIAVFQEGRVPYFCIGARQVARLRAAFPGTKVTWCRTEASFVRALPKAEVAVTWAFRQEWFARAPKLRCILSSAAGRDYFPLDPPPHVAVRYSTFHGALMAETVLGMMLAFSRGVLESYRLQLKGELWPREKLYGKVRQLRGSHAVIVGLGHIGEAIGQLLKPLGVRVTGVRRKPQRQNPFWFEKGDAVVTLDELDRVLPQSDHLILVLPSDTGTDNLIDARRLALLPARAVVYNVGRGNCIDERALARALKARTLSGACLDVFKEEPLTRKSPLGRALPGLVRMPHASAFGGTYIDLFVDEVIGFLKK